MQVCSMQLLFSECIFFSILIGKEHQRQFAFICNIKQYLETVLPLGCVNCPVLS